MANVFAVHSVGDSLVTYLRNSYPEPLRVAHPCHFALLSSGELNRLADPETTLSLFLYRVTVNEHLRNLGRVNGGLDEHVPLAIDLHYLLTVWADSALVEQTLLAWVMRELFLHPILDASSLTPEAAWGPGEVVQVVPAELSNEDVMRIWDALQPPYHLSVSYIARVVRIDADVVESARPAVATSFAYRDRWPEA